MIHSTMPRKLQMSGTTQSMKEKSLNINFILYTLIRAKMIFD